MDKNITPQPEIGGDLVRVHRAISRALEISKEFGTLYTAQGYPDTDTQNGYLIYVRCLVKLLHAHHVTEDKGMFPYLRDKLPDAPYDILMEQHNEMVPLLDKIKTLLSRARSSQPTETLNTLQSALTHTSDVWHTHIILEEAHFGPDAVVTVLSAAERRKAAKITANHSARHQFPLSLMLPFLLYNMPSEDREIMIQLMPGFISPMLAVWKPRWKIMIPFLLADA